LPRFQLREQFDSELETQDEELFFIDTVIDVRAHIADQLRCER